MLATQRDPATPPTPTTHGRAVVIVVVPVEDRRPPGAGRGHRRADRSPRPPRPGRPSEEAGAGEPSDGGSPASTATLALGHFRDFKHVNQVSGRDDGDLVLAGVAARIVDSFNPDVMFRLGGDEFAVISRHADPDELDDLPVAIIEEALRVPFQFLGLPRPARGRQHRHGCCRTRRRRPRLGHEAGRRRPLPDRSSKAPTATRSTTFSTPRCRPPSTGPTGLGLARRRRAPPRRPTVS